MGKRAAFFVGMFFLCWLGTSKWVQGKEKEPLTLEIHYIRQEDDYEGWNLWLWQEGQEGLEGQEGQAYPFQVDEEGGYSEIALAGVDENTRIGILIRKGDWEEKDIAEDRFLDLSQAKDGHLSVWLWQGEEAVTYGEKGEAAHIFDACLESETEIFFRGLVPSGASFQVVDYHGNEYELEAQEVVWDDNLLSGKLTLKEAVPLPNTFYLVMEDVREVIRFGGIYDTRLFTDNFVYDGDDLGVVYEKDKSVFKLWAPMAESVTLLLYEEGDGDNLLRSEPLSYMEKGVFGVTLSGDYANQYYTYLVNVQGSEWEVVDPYAKSTGVNGERGMILATSAGMPEGFEEDTFIRNIKREDVILYEVSVRDYTSDADSGVYHKGKFLGFTEENTVNSAGDSTGLSYLASLGVTHVHFLPIQDFYGVDEKEPWESYNWGYNPVNYFVPEGSYATDPYHGEVRVQELRKMIQSLHGQGIGVIMDAVYNHTYYSADSNFNRIVPGYYHRIKEDGSFSNGSKCGNELATERAMVRKYVVDAVKYWMREYHVDGFRFDLMGLIDVETMQEIEKEVYRINPHAVLYGEGWDAGETIYEGNRMESFNAYLAPKIGTLNNVFRRAVQNYICGFLEEESTLLGVKFGFAGAGDYSDTTARMGIWTANPLQCINYASCHDGYTLWDLISLSCPEEELSLLKRRDRFGAACVLLCQGTPFLHSGEEFLRTKASPTNPDVIYGGSYIAGDGVNGLEWKNRTENKDVLEYYKGLIAFRKEHRGLRYVTQKQLNKNLVLIENLPENVLGYYAREPINLFTDRQICLLFNPTQEAVEFVPLSGTWEIYVDDQSAGTQCLAVAAEGETLCVESVSALAAVRTVVRTDRIAISIAAAFLTMAVVCIVIKMSRRKKAWME